MLILDFWLDERNSYVSPEINLQNKIILNIMENEKSFFYSNILNSQDLKNQIKGLAIEVLNSFHFM